MAQAEVGVSLFGTTADGQAVQKVTLGCGGMRASILTWGSVLQSLRLDGVAHDLTLGSDRLADYEGEMRHHGALIGPVVNRIGGAAAPLGGKTLRLEANQDGRHCLHSGTAGTHLKVWRLAEVTDTACTLTLTLPDGEGGFPGNRRVTARWEVAAPATLRLDLTVTTDAPTWINFANHSYWNLDGSGSWAGHRLQIAADALLPTDGDFVPTGEVREVEGAFDLRQGRLISPAVPPLDNCFVLGRQRAPLRDVLWLTGVSGVTMTVATTEPGVQVYDGRAAVRPGGKPYEGLAIETQFWPDAPNRAEFPSIEVLPGEGRPHVTEWRFAR